MTYAALPDLVLEPLVRNALTEDMGSFGDITTRAVIPAGVTYQAKLNARDDGVVSGMQIARIAFQLVDPSLKIDTLVGDGSAVTKGQTLMTIEGAASSILMGERVALNFAGRLSGIASLTAQFVAQTAGTKTRITCTRKTTPGLRTVEKLAVLHGGGFNHRIGVFDAYLIKENHIIACGGITQAIQKAKELNPGKPVEVETESLEEVKLAIDAGADIIMLDNFDIEATCKAVELTDGKAKLESSGNITDATLVSVAETGIDFISIGALTKHVQAIDLSMRLVMGD